MKIAIISDIHDHEQQLEKALELIQEAGAKELIILGDIVAPTTLQDILMSFAGQIHLVFGNNDGDIQHLTQKQYERPNLEIYGTFGEVELDGINIAFSHKPLATHALARSGMYELILFGHTHIQHAEIIETSLVVNPGAVRPTLKPDHDSSFALFDTKKPTLVEFVNL